jgi:hypothetical protein
MLQSDIVVVERLVERVGDLTHCQRRPWSLSSLRTNIAEAAHHESRPDLTSETASSSLEIRALSVVIVLLGTYWFLNRTVSKSYPVVMGI